MQPVHGSSSTLRGAAGICGSKNVDSAQNTRSRGFLAYTRQCGTVGENDSNTKVCAGCSELRNSKVDGTQAEAIQASGRFF
jgi:hypothetical protein